MTRYPNFKCISQYSGSEHPVCQTKPLSEQIDYELRSAEEHLINIIKLAEGSVKHRRLMKFLRGWRPTWRKGKEFVAEVKAMEGC